jgi:hypothetical protein
VAVDGIFTPGRRPIKFGNDGTVQLEIDADGQLNITPTNRVAALNGEPLQTSGDTVTEIHTLSDFGPSGGIITLSSGHYQIKSTIDIGTNRFVFASGATVLFEFDDSFNNWIEHSGDSMTLFSGTATFRCLGGRGTAFIINGDDVTFIDITGSFGMQIGFIGFYGTGGVLGTVRGRVINQTATAGLLLTGNVFDGWVDGFTVINAVETSVRDVGGTASASATGSFFHVHGLSSSVIAQGSYIGLPAAASLFDIDPTVTANASISRFFLTDSGNFFEPSTKTGTFTGVADASIGATNIDSVTDSGGIARFNFATGPTVYVGQQVVVSDFTTNTDYNGTWFISATDGTGYFEVDAVNFGSTETGSFLSNVVTLTEVGTTAADGDSVLIDTDVGTSYDVGSFVFNKQTDSFQVNATWSATATGSWRNGSQDEGSKYVTVKYCGTQKDSRSLAAIYTIGNTDTISATADTWVDLDLGTAVDSAASSRFKMVDAENGEVEYIGPNPFSGILTASITAVLSTGPTTAHRFRIFKSNGTPAFESVYVEGSLVAGIQLNLVLTTPVNLSNSDRFKLQVQAIGTTTTITVPNLTLDVV